MGKVLTGTKLELPPRTRRIRRRNQLLQFALGTTSAHAENTSSKLARSFSSKELPPRTRRIQFARTDGGRGAGTTSAHAENTFIKNGLQTLGENYLRARGEYSPSALIPPAGLELPPRTRRILCAAVVGVGHGGTTSAHAENTVGVATPTAIGGNYLRARGEYGSASVRPVACRELPPRTRRIQIGVSAE